MAKNKSKQKALDAVTKLAIAFLEKHIKSSFISTSMGSGWNIVLYAPFSTNGRTLDKLDECMYLDSFDPEDEGVENWSKLSKKDKEYYYNDWKETLFESSLEKFKSEVISKHLHFFEEEVVQAT